MATVTGTGAASEGTSAQAIGEVNLPAGWAEAVEALAPVLWWRFADPPWQYAGLVSTQFVTDSSPNGRNAAGRIGNVSLIDAEIPADDGFPYSAAKIRYIDTGVPGFRQGSGSVHVGDFPLSLVFTYRESSDDIPIDLSQRVYYAYDGEAGLTYNHTNDEIDVNGHVSGIDAAVLRDGLTHLIVLTVGTTTSKLYIDGVQVLSSTSLQPGTSSNGTWKVGYVPGYYDDVVVYDYALSAPQVAGLQTAWGTATHHTVAPDAAGVAASSAAAEASTSSHTPVTITAPVASGSAASSAFAVAGAPDPTWTNASASSNASASARSHSVQTEGWPPTPASGPAGKAKGSRALTGKELAGALKRAGFTEDVDIQTGVSIALAASGGDPYKRLDNGDGTFSLGAWQISSSNAAIVRRGTWNNVYDNAIMAYKVWKAAGESWTPWKAYRKGEHTRYMSGASDSADNSVNPNVPLKTNLHSDQPILVPEAISEANHFPAVARIPTGFDGRRFRDGLGVLFRPSTAETLQLALHHKKGRLKDYSPNWRVADWPGAPGHWGVLASQRVGDGIYAIMAGADGTTTGVRARSISDVDVRYSASSDFAAPAHNTDLFVQDVRDPEEQNPRLWLMRERSIWSWVDGVGSWTFGDSQDLDFPAENTMQPILVYPWTSGPYGAPEIWWATKAPKLRWKLRRAVWQGADDGFEAAGVSTFAKVGPFRGMDMERDDTVFRVVRDPKRQRRLWLIAMQDSLTWGFWSANGGSNWSTGWSALPGIPARAALVPRPSVAGANTGHLLHTMSSGLSLGDAANVASTPLLPGTTVDGGKWTPPFHGSYHLSNTYGSTGPYASYHTGVDFIGEDDLTVHAVGPGTVHLVLSSDASYGNAVGIHHGSGVYTFYAHMQDGSVSVSVGQAVDSNTALGLMGETGNAFGAHTHVELRFDTDTYHGSWPVDHQYDILPYVTGSSDSRPNPPRGVGGSLMATPTGGIPTGAAAGRYNLGAVASHVAYACAEIAPQFGITTVYGVGSRPTSTSDHPSGHALDFMVSDDRGSQLAEYVIANADRLHVTYLIWRQQINSVDGGGWEPMEDRGSITANHFDHVHVSFEHGDFPVPNTAANTANDYAGGQEGDAEEGDEGGVPGWVYYYPGVWGVHGNLTGDDDGIIGTGAAGLVPDFIVEGQPVTFPIDLPFKIWNEPEGEYKYTGLFATMRLPGMDIAAWQSMEYQIEGTNLGTINFAFTYPTGSAIAGVEGPGGDEHPFDEADALALSTSHNTSWQPVPDEEDGDILFEGQSELHIYIAPRAGFGETQFADGPDQGVSITSLWFRFWTTVPGSEPDPPDPTPQYPGDPSLDSLPNDVIAVIGNKTGGDGELERMTIIFERGRDR